MTLIPFDASDSLQSLLGAVLTPNFYPWQLRMKNMSSLLAKSLRGLKSKCRILLTGTPVQNALQDGGS